MSGFSESLKSYLEVIRKKNTVGFFIYILKPIYSSSLIGFIISLLSFDEKVITENVFVIPISTFFTGGGLNKLGFN